MSNLISIDSTLQPVHSVCVFQSDRAEVRRILAVELKAGQNEVCVENLPNGIHDDSIRVEGLGNAVIFDVVYSPPPSTNDTANKKSSPKHDELRQIEKKIASLKSEKTILSDQVTVLEDYSKTLTADKADLTKLTEFLTIYKDRRAGIHAALEENGDLLEAAEKEADEKRKELRQDDEGKKRAVKITVVVLADNDGKAELSLWYVVSGASWNPMYDLRATISHTAKESSTISLQYRASISQSTGEDWTDVDLTLSTASPQLGTEIPSLSPYKIGHPRAVPQSRSATFGGGGGTFSRKKSRMSAAPGMPMLLSASAEAYEEPMYAMAPMAVQVASAVEGATSSTFVIAGRSTIPSDSPTDQATTHKVSIAFIDLQAQLEWISIPKMQASAFLRCQVKNTSQYILLPGASSVFMDNNFVCKSWVPSVSPQESFSTSLGVDPAIRVTYHNQQKKTKSSSSGLLASKFDVTSYTQRITIKNTRSGSASVSPLYVKDNVPVSEDSEFKVTVLEPKEMGLAKDRREVGVAGATGVKARWAFHDGDEPGERMGVEDEGVVEWVCDVPTGKSVDLTLAWEIQSPAGQTWARR